MAKELRFDVTALDRASQTFTRLGQAVERFEKRLERLDGKKVDAEVGVKTDQAEREIGRFATDARRKLTAALSNLPEVELDADSTPLDRKLADVRRRMAELADKTIGVDLSAEAAIAEAQVLQRELAEIGRQSPNIQVRADTAAAAAQLAAISAEVDRIDGRTATVRVNSRGASEALVQFAALGRALGTLAIPAALIAATPQLLSLAGSAAQAAGALGLIPAAGAAGALAVGALAVGFRGLGDALGDNPKKAAEALAEMAPAARDTVGAVRGLAGAWQELRLDVQGRMFSGLADQVRSLGGSYLPILRGGLGGVADGFNTATAQVAAFMARASTMRDWQGIVTASSGAVQNLSRMFAPLVSVFTDLAAVGAPILRQLAQGAADATARFAAFVSRARETGQLGAWMQRGVDVLRQMAQVAGNVGSSLMSMFRAANTGATPFLTTLQQATERMAAFLRSAEGQRRMVEVFNGIRTSVAALAPLFSALATAAGNLAPYMQSVGLALLALRAGGSVAGVIALLAAAFPPLITALSQLGPLIPVVVSALIGLRVASTLSGAFRELGGSMTTAAGGTTTFMGAVRGAGSVVGGFRVAASGLMGMMGGPFGVALAAGGVALGLLAMEQQKAAQKAQEHKAALDSITGTLDSYTGAATQATNAEIAKQLAADGSIDRLRQLGVDTASYTDAMAGNGNAIRSVTEQLHGQTRSAIQSSDAYRQLKPLLDANGVSLETVALAAEGNVGAQQQVAAAVQASSAANSEFGGGLAFTAQSLYDAGGASAQFQGRLNETVSALEKQRTALQSAAAAASDFGRELDTVKPGFAAMAQGASVTPQLEERFQSLAAAAVKNADAVGKNALQFGNVSTAGTAAAQAMQQNRDQFIQAATGAGMTEKAAAALADRLGLIPDKVRTDFENNAEQTALQLRQVNDQIRAVPPGKAIVIDALTAPAQQTLSAIGLTVRTLPDGRVEVTANTREAQANLDVFMRGAAEKRANVVIDGQDQPARDALANVLGQIAAGKGTVNIDGNVVPAQQAASYLLGTVGQMKGEVQIGANKAPADVVLNSYLQAVRTGQGTVTINGNKVPADQVLSALTAQIRSPEDKPIGAATEDAHTKDRQLADAARQRVDKPIGADVSGALPAVSDLHGAAQNPATMPVGADNTGGLDAVSVLQGSATAGATKPVGANVSVGANAVAGLQGKAQAGATKPVNANTGAGNSAVGGLQRNATARATKPVNADTARASSAVQGLRRLAAASVTMVVNVVKRFFGAEGGIVPAQGFADGGIHVVAAPRPRIVPLADGDVGDPMSFQGRRLTPMSASTPKIVGANTWRVIGDRASGDELFLPLVPNSAMSQTLLEAGATRMGRQLVPAGMRLAPSATGLQVAPMASGGLVQVGYGSVSRAAWDRLLSMGYRGRPGDRREALYVPRQVLDQVTGRAAPALAAVRAQVQAAQMARAAAPQVTVRTGMDVAELRAIHGQLVGLRGDLLTSGRWGPEMVEQLRGLSNRLLADVSATARAAAGRDLGSQGMW